MYEIDCLVKFCTYPWIYSSIRIISCLLSKNPSRICGKAGRQSENIKIELFNRVKICTISFKNVPVDNQISF